MNDQDIERELAKIRREADEAEKRSASAKGNKGDGIEPPLKKPVIAPAFSDEALALQFAERHAGNLRYVAGWGKWLSWTGTHWRFDDTLHAFDLVRQIIRETAATCNRRKDAIAIASAKTVAAVERLTKTDRRLAATVEQWDADPFLLNTPTGVVDLRTGRLRPHQPDDYMTKITAVGPGGDCPKFKAFLKRIMNEDDAMITYLQRVSGYSATGDIREQAMFFGHGDGNNGKGVFGHTIGHVLGDYCKTAAIETFTESKVDRHSTELARLRGARLVTATETESGRHWAEARIKELTGGDVVTARFMRQDDFEYTPEFKLFFFGNHKPGLRSVGVAMRRRVNLIPFAVIIPETERDLQLEQALRGEWPGVLQWMIDGCLDWQKLGLAPPDAVTNATDTCFFEQDSFSAWVEDRCERNPNIWTKSTVLFASWKDWAEKAGVRFGNIKTFGETMTEKGFTWAHTPTGNGYWGLGIRQDEPAPMYWQETAERDGK